MIRNALITTLFVLLNLIPQTKVLSNTCPGGTDEASVKLLNPRSNQILEFSCKNDTRREFIQINEDNTKLVATAFNNLNPETGEENLSLNTLNILKDESPIQFEKFDPSGKLERFEKYENQQVTLKFIEKAQRLEEFNTGEGQENTLSRECFYDFEEQKIRENKFHSSIAKTELFVQNSTEHSITVLQTTTIQLNNKSKELINENSITLLLKDFTISFCLDGSFLPVNIKGNTIYKNKKYTLLEEGLPIKVIESSMKENDIEDLLKVSSSEIVSLDRTDNSADENSNPGSGNEPANNNSHFDNQPTQPNTPSTPEE